MPENYKQSAWFRIHGELLDCLPKARRASWVRQPFRGRPAIKDPIEALGVPHTEVALILVDHRAVDLHHPLQGGERVELFPARAALPCAGPPLRPPLPSPPSFVVDVNLGRLARDLRLLGFDTLWRNDWEDGQIARLAAAEGRVVLTRDRRLLFRRIIDHGRWVRAVEPRRQLSEVVERFGLAEQARPLSRCPTCNGPITPVAKAQIAARLPPLTRRHYHRFYRCGDCGQLYWPGSHYPRLLARLAPWHARQ